MLGWSVEWQTRETTHLSCLWCNLQCKCFPTPDADVFGDLFQVKCTGFRKWLKLQRGNWGSFLWLEKYISWLLVSKGDTFRLEMWGSSWNWVVAVWAEAFYFALSQTCLNAKKQSRTSWDVNFLLSEILFSLGNHQIPTGRNLLLGVDIFKETQTLCNELQSKKIWLNCCCWSFRPLQLQLC